MKINLQKLNRRIFPFVVALVLFLSYISPLTANAEDINYQDYIIDMTVDDYGQMLTISLPCNNSTYIVYKNGVKEGSGTGKSYEHEFYTMEFDPTAIYRIQISPNVNNYLRLDNIPKSAEMTVRFSMRGPALAVTPTTPGSMIVQDPSCYFFFYDKDHKKTGEDTHGFSGLPIVDTSGANAVWYYEAKGEVWPTEGGIDDPLLFPNSAFMRTSFMLKNCDFSDNGFYTFSMLSYTLDIYIPDVVAEGDDEMIDVLNQLLGGLGKKIDLVTGQIVNMQNLQEQTNEKLDEMVGGTPEQNAQADSAVSDLQSASGKLDNLGDQLNSIEKPNVDSMNISADKLLGGMSSTNMLTAPILEIWKNPIALSILTVVVTIVLISWVFFGKK